MVEGRDHSLAELLSEEDCCSHRGGLPLGWICTIRHISLTSHLYVVSLDVQLWRHKLSLFSLSFKFKRNVAMLLICIHKISPSRNAYWPEALCFRWKVIGWQQVRRGNTWVLMSTVTPLRPQHPLYVLKRKHILLSFSKITAWLNIHVIKFKSRCILVCK